MKVSNAEKFSRMLPTTLLGRCPQCQQASIFKNALEYHDYCPKCKVQFTREEGLFLIATSLTYILAFFLLGLLAVILVRRYGFFDMLAPLLVGIAILFMTLTYRPSRAWAMWLAWAMGAVVTDEEFSENP